MTPLENIDGIIGLCPQSNADNLLPAAPMSAAMLIKGHGFRPWRLKTQGENGSPLLVNNFNLDSLGSLVAQACSQDLSQMNLLVVVDAMIGLPKNFDNQDAAFCELPHPQQKTFIQETFNYLVNQTLRFGGYPQTFFSHREVETLLESVGLCSHELYVQRRIQSLQLWKDLATAGEEDFQIWPFEPQYGKPGSPIVCEGFSPLAWQILNGSANREGSMAVTFERVGPSVEGLERFENSSLAEKNSGMLALLAWKLLSLQLLGQKSPPMIQGEILGYQLCPSAPPFL